jgi:hypothetical protein
VYIIELIFIHEGKYDYSENNPLTVTGTRSQLKIKCRICDDIFEMRFNSHYYRKSGCSVCAGVKPYTLKRFLQKAIAIHGNIVDYTQVKEEHIINCYSNVPLTCNIWSWSPTIDEHINGKNGCPNCANRVPYTLEIFIQKAKMIHMDLYNYSYIKEEHIWNVKSYVPILCVKCNEIWWQRIDCHIARKQGCPDCCQSKGELGCKHVLQSLGLSYQTQTQIPSLSKKRYDFSFIFQDKNYLLEFDGQYHFEYNDFFHRNEENFKERQQVDILKTTTAIQSGYCIIRIDYTQINCIEYHIRNALINNYLLYVTDAILYKHILDVVQSVANNF